MMKIEESNQIALLEIGKNLKELNDRVTRLENLAEATKKVLTAHECYINGLEGGYENV